MNIYLSLACYNLFLFNIYACAHPFYKTMPLEYEKIYQELKYLEKLIINIAKKDYPKIPDQDWDLFDVLEDEIQKKLSLNDDSLAPIQKPIYKELCLEEAETYCHNYFMYECNRLGLDQNKINFCLDTRPNHILGQTTEEIFVTKVDNTNMSFLDTIWSWYSQSDVFLFNQKIKPEIIIDVAKHDTIDRLKNTIKHELTHVCEAHGLKKFLLSFLIAHYYGKNELTRDNYKELIKYYKKAHELQANIVPALLEKNYHNTLADIKPIDYKSGTDMHPDGDVIHFWLQKIENASHNKSIQKNNYFSRALKKLYILLSFLKKQVS